MPLDEFHRAFDETYFGSATSYGEKFSMEFVELAIRFFQQKLQEQPNSKKTQLTVIAEEIDSFVLEYNRVEDEYKTDRVADSFRSHFAIEDEPLNSALHDRFAWFLFHKTPSRKNKERAEGLWQHSLELNPNNCDSIVNLAILNYQRNDIPEGDKYIDKARQLSRSYSFCLLNKAKARYYSWKRGAYNENQLDILKKASTQIDEATKKLIKTDKYHMKIKDDILKHKLLIKDCNYRRKKESL